LEIQQRHDRIRDALGICRARGAFSSVDVQDIRNHHLVRLRGTGWASSVDDVAREDRLSLSAVCRARSALLRAVDDDPLAGVFALVKAGSF
ncbi:hypothetical protein, partial [Rhodovulum sulfidophilum]|uniref:hypothetical protein n=1 Tax=Rhodovulum sulfidophilum TaxID=35806 RepID=UPI001F39C7F3